MNDLDEFRATYFAECAELLADLEEQLAALATGAPQRERVNAAFRDIHSIKGGAGAFGFAALIAFAHAYETLLDDVREGRVALDTGAVSLCMRGRDIVADLVAAARSGRPLPADFGAAELSQFEALSRGEGHAEIVAHEEIDLDVVPALPRIADKDDPAFDADVFVAPPLSARGLWEIRFAPHSELYARANDPQLLFRELATLGELSVTAVLKPLPALAVFEPFGVYCAWEMTLAGPDISETQVREVFEFVDGICDLTINELVELPELISTQASDGLGDRMPQFGVPGGLDSPETSFPMWSRRAEPAEAPAPALARTTTVEPESPAPLEVAAGLVDISAADPEADRRNGLQSIRVDLEKVDRVVDMVGELVIAQSMLAAQMDEALRSRYPELVRGLEVLAQTTQGLQDAVMAIRAQPVKSVFSRMPRLIRELAQKTGKKLRLETTGEATEIDRTVIEQLADPLTHMIRNAADHGIEMPARRLTLGKPETGTIRLSAEQAGGNILIVVEDDGAGINRARVLQVARERGLVGPDAQLGDEQIDGLIFAPGFSTAEVVSDISGRGVGLDVVMNNIKKIGGSVQVRSTPGRGTRMSMRLPLTLAVVEVMLVRVGGSPYLIPLSAIIETLQAERADFGRGPSGARMLRVRGEYVQVIDLCAHFGLGSVGELLQRFVVVCEAEGARKVALLVDDVAGQQQVVIKSLEQNFGVIEGIAGGTILGDGSVALIIDVQGLRALPVERQAA